MEIKLEGRRQEDNKGKQICQTEGGGGGAGGGKASHFAQIGPKGSNG